MPEVWQDGRRSETLRRLLKKSMPITVLAQRREPMLVMYSEHETENEVLVGVNSLRQTTATYSMAERVATAASARADVRAGISKRRRLAQGTPIRCGVGEQIKNKRTNERATAC